MNTDQIKTIDTSTPEGREELSQIAGEMLGVKARHKNNTFKHPFYYCDVCDTRQGSKEARGGCIGFAPIPLTWDSAMKWRDWAKKHFGGDKLYEAIGDVMESEWSSPHTPDHPQYKTHKYSWTGVWAVKYAQPEHYIKAAVICKLNAKGKK